METLFFPPSQVAQRSTSPCPLQRISFPDPSRLRLSPEGCTSLLAALSALPRLAMLNTLSYSLVEGSSGDNGNNGSSSAAGGVGVGVGGVGGVAVGAAAVMSGPPCVGLDLAGTGAGPLVVGGLMARMQVGERCWMTEIVITSRVLETGRTNGERQRRWLVFHSGYGRKRWDRSSRP